MLNTYRNPLVPNNVLLPMSRPTLRHCESPDKCKYYLFATIVGVDLTIMVKVELDYALKATGFDCTYLFECGIVESDYATF